MRFFHHIGRNKNIMTSFSEADLILNPDGSIYHLGIRPEHIAGTVLLVGDPGRVARISRHFDQIEFKASKREFITHTGTYKGKRISAMSTGMGVDNIEIAIFELDALVNIDLEKRESREKKTSLNLVRIGTSGAIQPEIAVGSAVASEHGVGLDNLLEWYKLDQTQDQLSFCRYLQESVHLGTIPYMVKGSEKLLSSLAEGLIRGITVTSPGFYAPQGRKLRIPVKDGSFLDKIRSFEHQGHKLTNFEMETSAIYAFARLLGHEALSINAVLGNRAQKTFTQNPYETIDSIIMQVLERL